MGLGEAVILILVLAALEGILSADNAMVLAILVRPLPAHLRKKALLYGIVGAYLLRGLALAFAAFVIKLWWIQALGAAYLLYLPIKHYGFPSRTMGTAPKAVLSVTQQFWRTVALVELTDLAFAIDSVLVAVALSKELWVTLTGVFLGILLLRISAGAFVSLLETFPRFEVVAYVMVGWAGFKLALESWAHVADEVIMRPDLAVHLPKWGFWTVTISLLVLGSIWALKRRSEEEDEAKTESKTPRSD